MVCGLLLILILVSGCASVEDLEREKKVSYDPIVCDYTVKTSYGTPIDFVTTRVIVYADNKMKIHVGDFEDDHSGIEVKYDTIYEEEFEISEEQKDKIINKIKSNRIITIGKCDSDSSDGSYLYLHLYDKDGKIVYTTGGLNPDVSTLEKVITLIQDSLPEDAISDVEDKAKQMLIERLLKEHYEEYSYLENY